MSRTVGFGKVSGSEELGILEGEVLGFCRGSWVFLGGFGLQMAAEWEG